MASRRRNKLVLGLFKDTDALEKLLIRLRDRSPLRNETFIFANEVQQLAIDQVISASLVQPTSRYAAFPARGKSRLRIDPYYPIEKQREGASHSLSIRRIPNLRTLYGFNLPEDRIVVGLNSPRAAELSDLFRKSGAIEVHYGGIPSVLGSAKRSEQVPMLLADIIEKIVPSRSYNRAAEEEAAQYRESPKRRFGSINLSDADLLPFGQIPRMGKEFISTGKDDFREILVTEPRAPSLPPQATGVPPAAAASPAQFSETEIRGGDGGPPSTPPPPGPDDPNSPTKRFLEGRYPVSVQPGKRFFLEVRIAVEPSAGTRIAQLNPGILPEDHDADVLLLLHAPNCTIAGERRDRTIKVPAKKNSDFALWELTPNLVETLTLSVTAYYGSAPLGELSLQVISVESSAPGETATSTSEIEFQQPDSGEITLEIRYDAKNSIYSCSFISTRLHTPDIASQPLKRAPEVVINDLISELNGMARGTTKIDPSEMRYWLRGKGLGLWREFVPDALQSVFWNERSNIRRLTIRSIGDPIPWELLYPTEPGKAPDPSVGFLGEAFELTRWRFGRTAANRIRKGRTCFVLPPSAPKQAVAEIDALASIVGGDSKVVGSLKELRGVLEGGDFGILHFACHNSFEQTTARINMPDGPLEPSTLLNYLNKFDSPLIVMNACRTDGQTQSYTRLSGWADSFLDAGVGAFVGSLWEIRDESAAQFATTFYEQLKTTSLGQAVKAARKSIDTGGGDPTWLAYSVYGSHDAKIVH